MSNLVGQPSNPVGQPSNPVGQPSNPVGQQSNPVSQPHMTAEQDEPTTWSAEETAALLQKCTIRPAKGKNEETEGGTCREVGVGAEFVCTICLLLAQKEPVMTPCEHFFCGPCWTQWMAQHGEQTTCPNCRQPALPAHCRPLQKSPALWRILAGVAVLCPIQPILDGVIRCTWRGTYGDCEAHQTTCLARPRECPNKCGRFVLQEEMERHRTQFCSARSRDCTDCGAHVRLCDTLKHTAECPRALILCNKQFNRDGCDQSFRREDERRHRDTECVSRRWPCEHARIGCHMFGNRGELQRHMDDSQTIRDHLQLALTALRFQRNLLVQHSFRLLRTHKDRTPIDLTRDDVPQDEIVLDQMVLHLDTVIDVRDKFYDEWFVGVVRAFPSPSCVSVQLLDSDAVMRRYEFPNDSERIAVLGTHTSSIPLLTLADQPSSDVAFGVSTAKPRPGAYWRASEFSQHAKLYQLLDVFVPLEKSLGGVWILGSVVTSNGTSFSLRPFVPGALNLAMFEETKEIRGIKPRIETPPPCGVEQLWLHIDSGVLFAPPGSYISAAALMQSSTGRIQIVEIQTPTASRVGRIEVTSGKTRIVHLLTGPSQCATSSFGRDHDFRVGENGFSLRPLQSNSTARRELAGTAWYGFVSPPAAADTVADCKESQSPRFAIGQGVLAPWKTSNTTYNAIVECVHKDRTYDIKFYDGCVGHNVPEKNLEDNTRELHKFAEGQLVRASWRGSSTKYDGVIQKNNLNYTYCILFYDGAIDPHVSVMDIRDNSKAKPCETLRPFCRSTAAPAASAAPAALAAPAAPSDAPAAPADAPSALADAGAPGTSTKKRRRRGKDEEDDTDDDKDDCRKRVKTHDGGRKPPKRATSAYMFFCKEQRYTVRAALSKKGRPVLMTAVSQELAIRWSALSEADRDKYLQLQIQDRIRYVHELAAFTAKAK